MPRKPTRKGLVRKLDAAVSQAIRARDKRCVVCGSRENLQCGHVFTRAAYSTRWDTGTNGNCHAQCSSCNLRHEYDPYPFYNWYIKKFGKKQWDALHIRHKMVSKLKDAQLVAMLDVVNRVTSAVKAFEESIGL